MDTKDPLEADVSKDDDDFKLIYDELKRQYDTLLRFDDAHDLKAGVILGFIVVIIVQITLSNEYINLLTINSISSHLFLAGCILLAFSFAFGALAIYLRNYSVGPKIPILYKRWYNREQGEKFSKTMFSRIHKAYKDNKAISQNKIILFQLMFVSFISAIIFIALSRIVSIVG